MTVAMDYAFGWEQVGGFQRTFEEAGGQLVQKLWPPLGTTDFGPFLAQIKRDADAVFAVMVAASALRFPKQYQDAGLKARLPLIGGGTTFDEFVLPSLGDEAIGAITPLIYSAAIDTPVNRRFVKEYRTKYGKVPSYYSETCYTAARWINEAAKAVAETSRTGKNSSPRSGRWKSPTRREDQLSWTLTATRSRTSMSARSRRKTVSFGTR